jgi:chromosome partitioning protein
MIVVGNEKGGSGKSTTAIHLAIALLHRGYSVGTLDLDFRQGSMTRYMNNRRQYRETSGPVLETRHLRVESPDSATDDDARAIAEGAIADALDKMSDCDLVIADTPGSQTMLSRVGHERADMLVTPINDSLLDIDVLAEIDPVRRTIVAPSFYCRMAWEYNNRRIVDGLDPVDWVVLRNRMAHVHSHNRQDVEQILDKLATRVGFRLAPGLSERVVYRELFSSGLTVLDLPVVEPERPARASHQSAVREITALADSLGLAPPARAAETCEPESRAITGE